MNNCPYWRNVKCVPPGSDGSHECNWPVADFAQCAVYAGVGAKLAGGNVGDQMRAMLDVARPRKTPSRSAMQYVGVVAFTLGLIGIVSGLIVITDAPVKKGVGWLVIALGLLCLVASVVLAVREQRQRIIR